MLIHPHQSSVKQDGLQLSLNGIGIPRFGDSHTEKSATFLGVQIDEHLSWKYRTKILNSILAHLISPPNQ